MQTPAARPADTAHGGQADRLKFLTHLREHGFSHADLAQMSHYEIDTVKAWFSKSPSRQREISDRALALIISGTGYSVAAYRAVVTQASN